ncbi:MAG TPA: class I SAM-dependent methyltransferase [Candidatus Acidoferrales bacterium]|nr:class I SAM-dependent methyltransferase [Candidatus Acidoferrales bacterium]
MATLGKAQWIILLVLLLQAATLALLLIFAVKARNRFRTYNREFHTMREELQNAISMTALGFRFPIFFGHASIDTFYARYLIQQLVAWRPKTIVELGSGASTILIARLMQRLGTADYEHISVEHDGDYLAITKKLAELNGVADRVTFLHCPLEATLALGIPWYAHLPEKLADRKIDLLIVDGPPAYLKETAHARYPALPLLYGHFNDRCMIIVDDANRDGERAVIDRWLKEYPEFAVRYRRRGKGFAILTRQGESSWRRESRRRAG